MPQFTTLITGLLFTECSRSPDGRLYLSDFYTHRVLAVTLDGKAETVAHVPRNARDSGSCPTAGC
jgi:hypothetical protein